MNRFIRKSWYTLTEAAAYLTQNAKGQVQVTVSDLLQLAVEGQTTITLRLFSTAPAAEGELAILVRPDDQVRDIKCPPNASINFCSDEKYEDLIEPAEIVEPGPPALVFETWRPTAEIKHEVGFVLVGSGKAIMRSWWLASLQDSTANLDQLIKLSGRDDANLWEQPIFLSVPDSETPRIAKTTLAALPDDTFMGITRADLDLLLADHAGAPADGQLQHRLIADEQLPDELDILITAWRKFWKNTSPRDKGSWPTKTHVERWLKDSGLSGKNADAGATMISPDWARKGGRR
tara:strand:- start:160 stop:1032 length:873 start_codon:yes stop_codon:yes gene_type:complete